MHVLPRKLAVYVGGFLGPSYCVELVSRNKVKYTRHGPQFGPGRAEVLEPTGRQWAAFRNALDEIGVWQWQKRYENPGVCDGTQWTFEVAYGNRYLTASGDNNYPGPEGEPNNHPEMTPQFRRLLSAVRALIGGREFQ